jgi:cytoskeletal protein CcmA (bactofilin family)
MSSLVLAFLLQDTKDNIMLITSEWLEANNFGHDYINEFNRHFPSGEADALKVLKKWEELGYFCFARWLLDEPLPKMEPLVIEEYKCGDIYYPGDVHIKKECMLTGNIIVNGTLSVDGKLILRERRYILGNVNSKRVIITNDANICGDVEADNTVIEDNGSIHGNVRTRELTIPEAGYVLGDVYTEKTNISASGYIYGEVKVVKFSDNK